MECEKKRKKEKGHRSGARWESEVRKTGRSTASKVREVGFWRIEGGKNRFVHRERMQGLGLGENEVWARFQGTTFEEWDGRWAYRG